MSKNEKTALVLITSHAMQSRPTIWEHIESVIKQQSELRPNLFPIICVHGDCTDSIKEKYEVVIDKSVNSSENKQRKYELLAKGVEAALLSGCYKTIVTNFGSGVSNEDLFEENMAVVGNLNGKELDLELLFCKTDTARRIFMGQSWNPTLSDGQNVYRLLFNVVGSDIEKLMKPRTNLWRFEFFSKDVVRFVEVV